MPDQIVDLEDIENFFEGNYAVDSASPTEWTFSATSGDYAGYAVTLKGADLGDSGNFPDAGGTITGVVVVDSGGDTTEVNGLSLAVSDFADEVDFADDSGDDDHGDPVHQADDDDDGGKDLVGSDDDNHLDGGGHDDSLSAGDGDDVLKGHGGDDDLNGDLGDDLLKGGSGKDKLDGGDGNDLLKGGGGKDKLDGGHGDDVLKGGGAKDKFIFGKEFGSDVVIKFDAAKEILDFRDTGLHFDDLTIVETKHGALLTSSEGEIHFKDLKGHLDESDFLF